MVINQTQRPQFYQNQYLGSEDLTAIVEYSRIQNARHDLGAHTWGIAIGLQLKEKPSTISGDQVDMYISPGYAWDGFGRPIVVLAPYKIPADRFKSIPYNAGIDGGNPAGHLVDIWLRYNEIETQRPRPGFEVCDPADQFARVQESFQIEVGNQLNPRDPIVIAGRTVDATLALQTFDASDPIIEDASIPHQTFPDDNPNAVWLIPLGFVRWKPNPNPGQPGNFVQRNGDDITQSRRVRQYIGVVAEGIQAADDIIRMQKRATDDSTLTWSDDLVWIEGNLRVDGDTRLFDGELDFLDSAGQDNSVPLAIQRIEDNGQGGKDLQVVIGQDTQGKNRFAVGHLDASKKPVEMLVVRDDGRVGIGTTTPGAGLQVTTHLAVGPFSATQNIGGIDVTGQAAELSFVRRTLTSWPTNPAAGDRFVWYNPDGTARLWTEKNNDLLTVISTGSVGIGTTTPARKLHVEGSEIHSGNAGAGFSFGNRETTTFVEGPAAGERWVWYASSGIARLWSGSDKLIVTPTGSVGIGTATPERKLHVEGDEVHSGGGRAGFSFGNWETTAFVANPSAGERWVWYASSGIARLWSGSDKLSVTPAGNLDVAGNITVRGNRTHLLGLDGAQTHWIMAGGTQEGVNNSIGLTIGALINTFHTGPGWVKGFLIHHPLQKEQKYLSHATLEGPEAAVFYRGEAELSDGIATVVLPDYFEALTRKEGRTVLLTSKLEGDTPVSTVAASEVTDGRFTVRTVDGENQTQKFYWEVKAVRTDVGILSVEQMKAPIR